jgi:HK97 gp10 family phage protein
MARNSTTIKLDTRVLDAMIKHTGGNVAEAVAKTAFAVEARAKIKAPVDTGALRASIYTSLKAGGRFDQARSSAAALRPNTGISELPKPQDDHTAYVGPSVEYAIEVHNGTTRMPGRPFLLQAVRETERDFRKNLGKAVKPK